MTAAETSPRPGTVAAFQEHLDWIMSRAQAAVAVPLVAASDDEKYVNDPTTNYGAW